MDGSCDRRILLSMSSLFASSTASTAAAAELTGGRLIGEDEGKSVVGLVGFDVGLRVVGFDVDGFWVGLLEVGFAVCPARVGFDDVGF